MKFSRRKVITLALQGGGALGALTWGVLDRLLEEPKLKIEAISGTSAGAINAAVPHTRSDFIAVMNEDVLVLPGCLRALRTALASGAAVAGLLLWEILNAGVVNLPAANWLQLLGSPVVETPVRQFFHKVHLDLLDLQEFLPLVFEQDVEFFMEVADFQLGF